MHWRSLLIISGVVLFLNIHAFAEDAPAKKAPAAPAPLPVAQPAAPLPPGAQQPAAVEGNISQITRDESTATGSLTIVDDTGKSSSYTVGEDTIFELVRGTVVSPSNFLREHRGERARVFPVVNGEFQGALKVQILLPPAVKRLYPTYGKVIAVTAGTIVIEHIWHYRKAPEPVVGVVTDVSFNQDTQTGGMTVQVGDKSVKFTASPWTRFVKVKDGVQTPTNFLKEYRGETVVVYLYAADNTAARQVDVILSGPALIQQTVKDHLAKYKKTYSHIYTFQVNAATVYEFVRDGKHFPAQFSNVLVGEIVSILPTGFHSGIAKNVDIHLPHALHGEVIDFTAASVTVKVHRHSLEKPAYDAIITVPLLQTTIYETVEDMMTQTVTFSALKKGQHVVIFRTGVPPHPAEKVVIHHHHKTVATRGTLTAMTLTTNNSGPITVTVKHPAKDGKPATTTPENFQVATTTPIVLASNQQPTIMYLGDDVTVWSHHRQGNAGPVEKIEVRPAAAKAVTAHGAFANSANGSVSINVKHGGKDGKPATTAQESFQLASTTTIVLASNQQATTLMPGDELTIHAHSRGGIVGPAEKIEVRRKKAKGK